jgi:hypothetical protein
MDMICGVQVNILLNNMENTPTFKPYPVSLAVVWKNRTKKDMCASPSW